MRTPLAAALVVGLLGASPGHAQQPAPASPIRARTVSEDLQMFGQVLNQIRLNHPDSVETHKLIMASVRGMVQAADPHSYVVEAQFVTEDREEALYSGRLHPVPIAFRFIGGAPVVVGSAPGSQASRQDILPGDQLISIDAKPVSAESETELELLLAGAKGSSAALVFERRRADGTLVQLARTVKRERVADETAVPAALMLDDSTGYVRITTFMAEKIAEDLRKALEQLEKRGMKRLVFDLRDNGGGSVDEAAKVAGEFLPAGAVVYSSEGRRAESRRTGTVSRSYWKRERQYPTVVLVNGGTASASELVAGALQDHDRALVVGRPTFGKALMMRGFPLTDGSMIVLTVGHVRTPCGRVIQRQYRGITSREYYRLGEAERDTVGRPSCRTTNGRTVFGGGGIYPDVVLPQPPAAPAWLARVRELDLPLQWVGGYLTAAGVAAPSVESLAAAPALPASALADFRTFAARQGVVVPDDAAATALLQRSLVSAVAWARGGASAFYRIAARLDPQVAEATATFDRAAALPGITVR